MKNKKIIGISIIIILGIIGLAISFYFLFQDMILELGDQVALDTKNYQTAIEIDSKAKFILFIDHNSKVSNIIYLNRESVQGLYHKKIEGKTKEKAIPLIIENLKKQNLLEDEKSFLLIDYGDSTVFSSFVAEFNKQFVVYAISKEITTGNMNLKDKLTSLNLEFKDVLEKDLKTLYYYSLDIINKYQKNGAENKVQERKEDIDEYALHLYQRLLVYSKNISNQEKDDPNGLDITTVNATGNYENEIYVTKQSWYYIKDSKVYAYLHFQVEEKEYHYCFLGSSQYTNSICSS